MSRQPPSQPPRKTETMNDSEATTGEFSRVFSMEPDRAPGAQAGITEIEIEAGADERRAVASRFGLISLDHLSASGTLDIFEPGCGARLDIVVTAEIVQTCVVTLEPVTSHIEDRLVIRFEPCDEAEGGTRVEAEILVDIGDQENTEPLPENGIDVGEAVAECLGLALDPYPRSQEADSALDAIKGGAEKQDRISPFAALEQLKRN